MSYFTVPEAYDLEGLLASADAQCGGWADFFKGVLLVQGIDDAKVRYISDQPLYLSTDAEPNENSSNIGFYSIEGILVKNWDLTNPQWSASDQNHDLIDDGLLAQHPHILSGVQPPGSLDYTGLLYPYVARR